MSNPIRPNPDDETEIAWADAVTSHVVRAYATEAERNTDNPTPHVGQLVTITTAGGGTIVQTWDGAYWRTHPGATAAHYEAFPNNQYWDNGWYSQLFWGPLTIRKRGPSGVTRLLVGAWINGLYSGAASAGVAVGVGNDVGGPTGDAGLAGIVEVGRGQLQTAPGVSVGGWNVLDRAHGDQTLGIFWLPIVAGVRVNAGLSGASLVVFEVGA